MKLPAKIRQQLLVYEAAGFHVLTIEPSKGSHWKVVFQEFSAPQFLTTNANEPRALRNNLARFKRLTREQHEPNT